MPPSPSPMDPEESTTPPPRRRAWLPAVLGLVVAVAVITTALLTRDAPAEDEPTESEGLTLLDVAELTEDTPGRDEPAPDFSMRTFDDGSFTLSHHLADDGRPVILNLWASWCLPCRTEMPIFDEFAADHPEVAVVGVAVQDDLVSAADFAEEIAVSYTLGYDEREEVSTAYRALGLPATFWISSEGIIVKRLFGVVTEESLEEDLALFD